MDFSKVVVLSTFRSTRTGDFFTIQDGTFYSMNAYTFNQFAAGNYDSITYDVNGELPPTNDAAGNPRPVLKNTIVKSIVESGRAKKLSDIDTAKLDLEVKKIRKESKDLGDDI